jgi:uncharacterized protein YaaN involved in tellurite resistance
MEDKLGRILDKIDTIDSSLTEISVTLGKQEVSLSEHIKRTNLLEERIELLREEMRPVEKHVFYMHGALKALGVVSLIIGVLVAIKQLLF